MPEIDRDATGAKTVDTWEEPALVVHGPVAALTAGNQGPVPEIGAAGSFLPDDTQIP